MSLPTPAQIDEVVQVVSKAATDGVSVLGFQLDAGEVQAIIQAAVDALCMRAWRQAQAAGQAAADAITTEAQAEASERAS